MNRTGNAGVTSAPYAKLRHRQPFTMLLTLYPVFSVKALRSIAQPNQLLTRPWNPAVRTSAVRHSRRVALPAQAV